MLFPIIKHPLLELASGAARHAQAGKRGNSPGHLQLAPHIADLVDDPVEDLLVEAPVVETLVLAGPHGALSHSKVGLGKPSSLLYNLEAAVAESRAQRQQAKEALEAAENALQAALSSVEAGAQIDLTTPADGHCLFWSMLRGGLLVPDNLGGLDFSIAELRAMALAAATPAELELAAISTLDADGEPLSVETYRNGMLEGLYGDHLMIACLARIFDRDITVVSTDSSRTFLAAGLHNKGMEETHGNFSSASSKSM